MNSRDEPAAPQGRDRDVARQGGTGAQAPKGRVSDESLVRELYAEHAAPLLRYALRMTDGDRQRAEDIVQETLFRAWQHPEAIARFEALRRAWQDATTHAGGTGLVVYFEHVDLQLATLCGDNGPFSGCLGRHNPAGPAHRLGGGK